MHDRCLSLRPTPEEGTRLRRARKPGLACYLANLLDNTGTGTVARQQHIEVVEARLLETLVKFGHLFSRSLASFKLFVSRMIAWLCVKRAPIPVASWLFAESVLN